MIHVTYRLTVKNRDQLRNPTLGSRVWATFTFFNLTKLLTTSMFDLITVGPKFTRPACRATVLVTDR